MTTPTETVHLFGARARTVEETITTAKEALRSVAPYASERLVDAFVEEFRRRLEDRPKPATP